MRDAGTTQTLVQTHFCLILILASEGSAACVEVGVGGPHSPQYGFGEAHLGVDVIPHAADVVNGLSVGKDGRTLLFRLYLRPFKSQVCEFSEQVLAKLKRKVGSVNQRAFAAPWHVATWVGFCSRSGEHVVVLKNEGLALRVRTV